MIKIMKQRYLSKKLNFQNLYDEADRKYPQDAVQTQSWRARCLHKMKSCIKNVFEQKIIKIKKSKATVNPGRQKVTLLEEAKMNRNIKK